MRAQFHRPTFQHVAVSLCGTVAGLKPLKSDSNIRRKQFVRELTTVCAGLFARVALRTVV